MNILGLSAYYHDSAACLVSDGRIVAAAQEERFTRRKHDASFPRHGIQSCLDTAGLEAKDIDLVAFYEKPLTKFDRVMETAAFTAPRSLRAFVDTMPKWFSEKLRLEPSLEKYFGYTGEVLYAEHHESHAASAFYASPFESAATLTLDGVGEWHTNTLGVGDGSSLQLTHGIEFPHSLGLLYSAVTQYLGFKVNNGEYKVMGLAPYGRPRFRDAILEHLIELQPNGAYRLHLEAFNFLYGQSTINPSAFASIFQGPARRPEGPLDQRHMDVAASIQAVTELVVMTQAKHLRDLTQLPRLCMAGGVALNSVANGKLAASGLFDDLWIQPAAGDAGGAIGAALVAWHKVLGNPRSPVLPDAMSGAYLGPKSSLQAIDSAIAEAGLRAAPLPAERLYPHVAERLAQGEVIGWFQGRMEFGPRALGHRSILADPRTLQMQARVNASIKFREGFRPFAPAVLEERATEWFDLPCGSPYMLHVVPVQPAKRLDDVPPAEGLARLKQARSQVAAVTHVDDSARVQTVSATQSPAFHRLLEAFYQRTNVPILMNTSFNLRGEPIVCTAEDAIATFLASGMDALVLEDRLIIRPVHAAPTGQCPAPPDLSETATPQEQRAVGLALSAILLLIGATLLSKNLPLVSLSLAGLSLLLTILAWKTPSSLAPVESTLKRIGKTLGHFNGRLLFGLLYLVLFTPIAVLRRAAGRSAIRPKRASWITLQATQSPASYQQMYTSPESQ